MPPCPDRHVRVRARARTHTAVYAQSLAGIREERTTEAMSYWPVNFSHFPKPSEDAKRFNKGHLVEQQ